MKNINPPEKFDHFVHVVTRIKDSCLVKKESNVTTHCNSLSPGTKKDQVVMIPDVLPVGCIVLVQQENGKLRVGVSKFNHKKETEHGNTFNLRTGYNIAVETSVCLFIVTLPDLITISGEFIKTIIRDHNIVGDLIDICSRENGKPPVNVRFNETMRSLRYDLTKLNKEFKRVSDENELLKSRLRTITHATYRLNRKVTKLGRLW